MSNSNMVKWQKKPLPNEKSGDAMLGPRTKGVKVNVFGWCVGGVAVVWGWFELTGFCNLITV